jgi:hypothetical protein
VCEDPGVVLRLLATSRALGEDAAAAAAGRLRLTLGGEGLHHYKQDLCKDRAQEAKDSPRARLRQAQAAFVTRRAPCHDAVLPSRASQMVVAPPAFLSAGKLARTSPAGIRRYAGRRKLQALRRIWCL